MKTSRRTDAQSATSLPRAPEDGLHDRTVRYGITMLIRTVCFILMVAIHPYGWWTLIFAAGAIFLPYFAVVVANVGYDALAAKAVAPERELAASAADDEHSSDHDDAPEADGDPLVIRITESPRTTPPPAPDTGSER